MKPVYLSFENVKGRDGQYDLRPINIMTGQNGAGKSAVLWAATIATLGYHPKLGKHNIKSKKLMGGLRLDMTATLRFDDSTSNFYSLKLKPDGELKKTVKFDHDDFPEVLYDLHAYLNMEAKERIKEVASKIDDKTLAFDEAEFLKTLQAIEVIPAAECKLAITELTTFVTERFKRRANAKMKLQDFLEMLVKELEDEKKRFKILKDQASAQMIGNRSATIPKSVQPQIDELKKQLTPLTEKLTALKTTLKQISDQSIRRNELNNIIARAVPDVAENEKAAKLLETEISSYVNPVPAMEKELQAFFDDPARNKIVQEIAKQEKVITELTSEILHLGNQTHCPYCRSRRKDWKEEYEKELIEKKTAAQNVLNDLAVEDTRLKVKGDDIQTRLAAAKEQFNKSAKENISKNAKLLSLRSEIKEGQKLAQEKAAAENELKGMTAATGTVDAQEIDSLQIQVDQINAQITPLDQQQVSYSEFSTKQDAMKSKEKELLAAQTREEVFKRASAEVTKEQANIVTIAFKPIIEKARLFTNGILPGDLDYNEGDIGMHTPEGWVDHVCMGTFHQTVAYIGLSIALAQQSPSKIVLLDEAGIIHPNNKPKIINRLLELHKNGTIDAVFITDPTDAGYDRTDTNIQIVSIT
jgi:hypothetical protein